MDPRPAAVRAGAIAALALVYYATARFGLGLDAVSGFATLVWPPTGIALAALVIFGEGLWPGVAAGAFLANYVTGAHLDPGPRLLVALGIAGGNTLEALAGARFLALARIDPALGRLRDAGGFVVFAALASTTVSATLGVLSLGLGGAVPAGALARTWAAWWLGDVLGDLTVGAALLSVVARVRAREPVPRLEGAAFLATAACVSWLAFGAPPGARVAYLEQPYVIFPVLIWGAVRFEQLGATVGTLVASAVAIGCAARGRGPFASASLADTLTLLQTFMGVTAPTFLVLGAVVAERRAALRQREDFLSVASHELNTPVAGLLLQLDVLERAARAGGGAPPEETAQALDVFRRRTRRLAALVTNLLDLTRIRAGRLAVAPERMDLREVAAEVARQYGPELERAQCPLDLRLPSEPVVGPFDRVGVEQILGNLLSNAGRYGAGAPVTLRIAAAAGRAAITVEDGGPGIRPEDRERIFERFERASAGHGGLGLGLFIARQIAVAHGGSIRLESEGGAGARFIVELPL